MSYTYATVCSGVEGAPSRLRPRLPPRAHGRRSSFPKSPLSLLPFSLIGGPTSRISATWPPSPSKMELSMEEQELFPFMAPFTCSPGEPLAKTSPSQDVAPARNEAAEPALLSVGNGCVLLPSWPQELSSGKMSLGRFPPTTVQTSPDSWPRFQASGMASHGVFWTASTPEWTAGQWPSRSVGVVSGLSEWLMETSKVPPRYFLSPRACLGVLARSERRGRPLPPALEQTLRLQASITSSLPPITLSSPPVEPRITLSTPPSLAQPNS